MVVKPTRNGIGVFANAEFARGKVIDKIAGRIVHHRVLWRRGGSFAANCIRFGPNTYLNPCTDIGRYLNHSCEPNAGIRKWNNQLFLFAATRVAKGSEIVVDYSTTIGDDDIWTMRCNCGCKSCRTTIRHFGSMPIELQRKYLKSGLVPEFIIRTLER